MIIKRQKKSFTLIELLIVISIIGLLSTVVLVSISPVKSKTRDTRRKTDLISIRSALEMYYQKYEHYPRRPVNTSQGWGGFLASFTESSDTQPWIKDEPLVGPSDGSLTEFINPIPVDPAFPSGYSYLYGTDATGQIYDLNAILEEEKDPQTSQYQCWKIHTSAGVIPPGQYWCQNIVGGPQVCTQCGGAGPALYYEGWNYIYSDHP